VGWYWNCSKSTPECCYIPLKSRENDKKVCLTKEPLHRWSGSYCTVHYVKVEIFFEQSDPYCLHCEKQFLDPYIVNDPTWQVQLWSGHWVKTKKNFIFLTFGRDTTNYMGTLVENVRKVKIQPTLLYSSSFARPSLNLGEGEGIFKNIQYVSEKELFSLMFPWSISNN
jgi:hypothetical protein